jgi:hypothetical protein
MSNDWLAAHSFRQTQQVLSAINIILLQTKLALLHAESPVGQDEYNDAISKLKQFIETLQKLLQEARERDDHVILGTNPRMNRLASQFLAEQSQSSLDNLPYDFPLEALPHLLRADDEEQRIKLIEHLDRLRSLLELHKYDDAISVFGEG